MQKQFKIFIFLFLLPFIGFSNDDFSYSKQKTISKAYIVNSDAGIDIENSYGSIFVSTWNEDKIEINVQIKVSGDSEKWVNQKLDAIDVTFIGLQLRPSSKIAYLIKMGETIISKSITL
jgi:hypothetical protein